MDKIQAIYELRRIREILRVRRDDALALKVKPEILDVPYYDRKIEALHVAIDALLCCGDAPNKH